MTTENKIDLPAMKAAAKAKEKAAKAEARQSKANSFGSIIISISMLLVVLSIAYSTYRILTGTNDIIAWALTAPQALFASYILVKKFIK